MSNKPTVIYHSADYDGIFCREIARKFLPDATLIGWNFGDPPLSPDRLTTGDPVYVMDLPVDRLFAIAPDSQAIKDAKKNLIWIDHHQSSIATHPKDIPGYRIDGVAACRLAWQWFASIVDKQQINDVHIHGSLPTIHDFINRSVVEPLAVRLAGEYDVFDKRNPDAETFNYGMQVVDPGSDFFEALLAPPPVGKNAVHKALEHGGSIQRYAQKVDASICQARSFLVRWHNLTFLTINSARFNSQFFAVKDKPETGHDALMGFYWDGDAFHVSLYHAKHRTDINLADIAVSYRGGGHKGACGFTCKNLPFVRS